MREFTIGRNDAGQRLDRFLSKAMPLLPPALLQKYIRIKRVKCNGGRCQRDQRLQEGDVLSLYINDEFFEQPREDNLFLTLFQPKLDILYEDENILLVDKRPGLVVHADETETATALTGIPAASSSPRRTRRRCGFLPPRSGTGRSQKSISALPWAG